MNQPEDGDGTVLLCFDGSEPARHAIERAGAVLAGRSAIVLTVWESVGSALLRHAPSGTTELGREARERRGRRGDRARQPRPLSYRVDASGQRFLRRGAQLDAARSDRAAAFLAAPCERRCSAQAPRFASAGPTC